MNRIWYVVYALLVAIALIGGYNSLAPEQLQNMNPDALFCGSILLILPLFILGSFESYDRQRGRGDLVRPSLQRNPLWSGGPLQSLFTSTCIMVSVTIGGVLRRPFPPIGSVGFWRIGMFASIALGLVIAQLVIYRVYRDRIIAGQPRRSTPCCPGPG